MVEDGKPGVALDWFNSSRVTLSRADCYPRQMQRSTSQNDVAGAP
jgi:hypothetical protein